jgi:hypothetical protein
MRIKSSSKTSSRRRGIRAEKARREFNVWAWEQNRQGRQVRLSHT